MVLHTWNKLDGFPVAFVVVFLVGILVPFIIALSKGDVTPYVPYISEAGGHYPEAGAFSFLICISNFICQWVMYLRYLLVERMILGKPDGLITSLNKLCFYLGFLSTIGLLLVTSFPTTTVSQLHNSAAGTACLCYVLYQIFQTWMSLKMDGNRSPINIFRLFITICSVLSLLLLAIFGVLGSQAWTAAHWTGKKTPKDDGFAYYVTSASAEWTLAVLLMLYFLTYIPDFKRSSFKFQMEINDTPDVPPRLSNLDIRKS